jgi:8-oxo-dGTP pyrophosphatase MutT (NUDIX family)
MLGSAIDAPVSILMVTSRETRRWVIPKGNTMRSVPPHTAAAIEAEEEAGVRGDISPTPLGAFRYRKRRRNGTSLMLEVDVFALAVTEELATWKEKGQRERRWFSLAEAADAVEEADLAELIRHFNPAKVGAAASGEPVKRGSFAWFKRLLP